MIYVLLVLATAGHLVLWISLVNRLHAIHMNRHLLDGITFLFGICLATLPVLWLPLIPPPPFGVREEALDFPVVWNYLGYSYLSICIAVLAAAIFEHVRRSWHPERRVPLLNQTTSRIDSPDDYAEDLVRKGVPRHLATIPGNEAAKPVVVRLEIAIDGLPDSLDGLRIVHLSDLHMSGRFHQRYYQLIVEACNQLEGDIVALTGDIVEKPHCIDWIDQTLNRLSARHARLFILGNHDLKVDCDAVRARFAAAGWLDVSQQQPLLASAKIQVVGNESPWFPPPNMVPARQEDTLRLCLTHTPDLFPWAAQHQFDLLLAGHNHGGQIQFPIIGPIVAPSRFGTRYANGLFRRGKTIMHVSPGTGSLAPLRWGCPPQLTLLVLRREGA